MRASRNNGAGGSLHPSQHGVPIGDGRRSLRAVKWLASCPPSPRSMIDPGASKLRREASCAGPGGGVFGSFGVGMVPAEPSSLHQHPGASSQNDLASSTCVWLVALGRSGDRRLDDRALRLWSAGWRSVDDCGTRSSADRVVHDLGVETREQRLCDGDTRGTNSPEAPYRVLLLTQARSSSALAPFRGYAPPLLQSSAAHIPRVQLTCL